MTQAYTDILRMLSQAESTEVVLFPYPGRGEHAKKGNAPQERRRFFDDLKAVAAQHRFGWADVEGAFDAVPESVPVMVNDLHYNEHGHRLMYEALIAEFDRMGTVAAAEG